MKDYRPIKNERQKRKKRPGIVTAVTVAAICCAGIGIYAGMKQTGGTRVPGRGTSAMPGQEKAAGGYAVSSSSPEATETGCQILESGGNAVDAAVAMSYALTVSEPHACGVGGGGCMLVYDPESQQYYFYDYGAEAPESESTWQVLVPGFVSGMEAVNEDFGTMEMADLMEPAIQYCDGVEISEVLETKMKNSQRYLMDNPVFTENGHLKEAGDILVQKDMKETLQQIAENGEESFYTGSIARDISKATGLTMEDMSAYETIRSGGVVGTYGDYEIVSASAPFSGETLIQILKMTEQTDMPDPEDGAFTETLNTIMKLAHSERVSHIYDLRFSENDIHQNERVTDDYIKELLKKEVGNITLDEESEDTTAFTVIDKNGMIVACTNTLSSFFGSKIEVDGFYMNNTGTNFGTGVNAYEGGKRPRTHIAPTILRSEDDIMAIASPGGNVIEKVLSTVLMDICEYGTEPQEAVDKQRIVCQGIDVIYYETGYDTPLFAALPEHSLTAIARSDHAYFGNIALSGYKKGVGYYSAEDIRRGGKGVAVTN